MTDEISPPVEYGFPAAGLPIPGRCRG